jgi:hypothetical protein
MIVRMPIIPTAIMMHGRRLHGGRCNTIDQELISSFNFNISQVSGSIPPTVVPLLFSLKGVRMINGVHGGPHIAQPGVMRPHVAHLLPS